jgi:hypothetical protein
MAVPLFLRGRFVLLKHCISVARLLCLHCARIPVPLRVKLNWSCAFEVKLN